MVVGDFITLTRSPNKFSGYYCRNHFAFFWISEDKNMPQQSSKFGIMGGRFASGNSVPPDRFLLTKIDADRSSGKTEFCSQKWKNEVLFLVKNVE